MTPSRPSFRSELIEWFAGFIGAALLVAVAPRALRFFVRQVLGRIVAEVASFVAFGFLVERLGGWISRRPRSS